jgi:hypothetical protein
MICHSDMRGLADVADLAPVFTMSLLARKRALLCVDKIYLLFMQTFAIIEGMYHRAAAATVKNLQNKIVDCQVDRLQSSQLRHHSLCEIKYSSSPTWIDWAAAASKHFRRC